MQEQLVLNVSAPIKHPDNVLFSASSTDLVESDISPRPPRNLLSPAHAYPRVARANGSRDNSPNRQPSDANSVVPSTVVRCLTRDDIAEAILQEFAKRTQALPSVPSNNRAGSS